MLPLKNIVMKIKMQTIGLEKKIGLEKLFAKCMSDEDLCLKYIKNNHDPIIRQTAQLNKLKVEQTLHQGRYTNGI